MLAPDGSVQVGYEPRLSVDELMSAHRLMRLSRQFDERAFSLQRQGRLGTFSPAQGQEAAIVGAASALDPARDWIVPQYRELPALVRHGYPLASFFRYLKGDPAGGGPPVGVNMLPLQISLAAQLPHAVGLAWGLGHQGRDSVVMVFFGDGAASEGDTHEAMNLAGIRRAPVVFILQNNGWAISTPVSSQNAAPNYAARAAGYGFPGLLVDGNDLFAMADAARWAVARARAGEGATLIEARTYRLGPHNTADEPGRYMPEHELEERRRLEPLVRLETYLRARGLLDEQREAALTDELIAEVNDAFADADQGTTARADQLFEHVYMKFPSRVVRQREEVARWQS